MKYVVAVGRKEAEDLAEEFGWDTIAEAQTHLKEVQAPPTDPYYAQMYRVYRVGCQDGKVPEGQSETK